MSTIGDMAMSAALQDERRELRSAIKALRGALENSNSLFAAMLHEKRPDAEIEAQIYENRSAMVSPREAPERDAVLVAHLQGRLDSPRPFHGAECPDYPNCKGGCGLGCTHDVEARPIPSVSSQERA